MPEISKDELRNMMKEVLAEHDGIKKLLSNQKTIPEQTLEHACACPDCYCDIIEEMNKTSDYACAHCGLPLGSEEFAKKIDKCPNCGEKKAKKIERPPLL